MWPLSTVTSFYRQVAGRNFDTDFRLTVEASTTMLVKVHGYLQVFRNVCFPLCNKGITAFSRHPEECLIPTPQSAFCFTNLSCLVLEIFKFFEKNTQNLNAPQNNSATWDLQMGFNSVR
jgi:hypothetical protein